MEPKELVQRQIDESQTHLERHQMLHRHLDELFADFILHNNGRTTNTILDLIIWSSKQTQNIDHQEGVKDGWCKRVCRII